MDDAIEVLRHSPNLVDFAFWFPYQKLGTTQPLVQLPRLSTLVIDADMDPANLFDCLIVPRLRNLNVSIFF
jgi:hypothetical protein